METKVCKKCGIEKPLTEFRKTHNKKYDRYYYRTECHDCELNYGRTYELTRADRTEYNKEYNKKYREKNKDVLKEKNKQWRENNKEQIKEQRKEEYKNNRDKVLARQKEYYEQNKERVLEYHHKYNKNNSEMLVKKTYKYQKYKEETDEFYKFKRLIRDCVLKSFKRKNHRKNSYAKEIIGTDFETAWNYLKETWKKNYGIEYNGELYHIDHIIPLSTAKTEEDVIRLCHYTNLQLLKPEDNLEKSDKLDWKKGEITMKTKLKEKFVNVANYGAGDGTEEKYIYECPCGKGEIIEEHCNVPGFREHDVYIVCEECSKKWIIKGNTRNWELVKK